MELTISTPRLAAARILPRTPRAFYRTAINAFFFVMGMVFASWAVRIPDIKAALQMSDAALGSVLLAAPLGEMLSIAPTAWLIGRFRSRRAALLDVLRRYQKRQAYPHRRLHRHGRWTCRHHPRRGLRADMGGSRYRSFHQPRLLHDDLLRQEEVRLR